ncbi:MAG: transposase, partial [Pseudomonadota bacterium]
AEVLGFCLMGNHFHLLIRMHPGEDYDDEEIKRRYKLYYGEESKAEVNDQEMIRLLREKWGNLSECVKEIKQGFSRFYNRRNNRKGFFWSERFKSVIVDNGETLINCLAYIDLNPVRAGIVKKPEQYRWCSLGYHVQTNNGDGFLWMDFGLREFGVRRIEDRLGFYLKFVYTKGVRPKVQGERQENHVSSQIDRFRHRTRYFTDSGIIGTKDFVARLYQSFKEHFSSRHEKRPRLIQGLDGVFSLKRLSEEI